MNKKAIIQDILLDTYWVNFVGKTNYPGVKEKYLEELERNMAIFLKKNISLNKLIEILTEYGYNEDDVIKTFQKMTKVDPKKIIFFKEEMLNNLPPQIPYYNNGFGFGKKENEYYYVLKDDITNSYVLFVVTDKDIEPKIVDYFVTINQAIDAMKKKCKKVYRFDIPVWEEVIQYKELNYVADENFKKWDLVFNKMSKMGELNFKKISSMLEKAVKDKELSFDAAIKLIKVYAEDKLTKEHKPEEEKDEKKDVEEKNVEETQKEELKEKQEISIKDELKNKTPLDYFKSNIPNRLDYSVPDQIKSVLVYINNKSSDISKYQIKLYKLNYELQQTISRFVSLNPEVGNIANEYIAMISLIIEIKDKSSNIVKYGLMVFFISPDGSVSTSDSFKGEDDIVYGFTENGIDQYFAKNI